jgi:FkbM family methyltransferase
VGQITQAIRGAAMLRRAQIATRRHPELGEISEYCFYATRLRRGDIAFDIGAHEGTHTRQMLNRGARVVAVEPQADLAADLARRYPTATVLQVAVSDEPGEARLNLSAEHNSNASLDPTWAPEGTVPTWRGVDSVGVVTLADLVERYGMPQLIKSDTESFDHRVVRTLDRPVEHVLFEVHGAHQNGAQEALRHLDALGSYEYRLARRSSWLFTVPTSSAAILAAIATWDRAMWGNVYARQDLVQSSATGGLG